MFLPHPRVKLSIVGSLRDREVACSASDRQGSNFESCVWRTVSSHSSHHPQEVLLAQFILYVHKGGLKPDSFHFYYRHWWPTGPIIKIAVSFADPPDPPRPPIIARRVTRQYTKAFNFQWIECGSISYRTKMNKTQDKQTKIATIADDNNLTTVKQNSRQISRDVESPQNSQLNLWAPK